MIAIALGQMIMSFNVASLPVAMGGMVQSFGVPPTTVATGIVAYSMLVAGFVMLGAKLAQRFGAVKVFRGAVVLFCASQILMTFSPNATADDISPSPLRHGRGCDRAVAGGADRRELQRAPAGDGRRRARLGACRRRRAGVHHRRRSRHIHRLAAGVRDSDRRFRPRFLPELPSQARPRTARRADRPGGRRAGGVGDHPHQLRLQQSERLGPVAGHGPTRRSISSACRRRRS